LRVVAPSGSALGLPELSRVCDTPLPMIVDVRHLLTLKAIAETGSLTRAAKRRALTLSAISHQIRELEHLLGVTLIERRTKPLALAPAGARLVACAELVLPAIAQAESDAVRLGGASGARLHLALECHSCFEWLLPAIDALREAWSELDIDLRLGPRFDPIPALLSGEVDAVLGTDRTAHPGVHYDGIFRYEIVLVVPATHALARKSSVEARDLLHESFVTYPVELERLDVVTRFLRPAGVEPKRARTAELTSVLLQLVKSGRGVAALPSWALFDARDAPELRTLKLGKAGLHSELFVAVREDERGAPHQTAFLSIARKTAFELLRDIEPMPT
jgi:LysR family transcriptional regulator, regulator for metE and metH